MNSYDEFEDVPAYLMTGIEDDLPTDREDEVDIQDVVEEVHKDDDPDDEGELIDEDDEEDFEDDEEEDSSDEN